MTSHVVKEVIRASINRRDQTVSVSRRVVHHNRFQSLPEFEPTLRFSREMFMERINNLLICCFSVPIILFNVCNKLL